MINNIFNNLTTVGSDETDEVCKAKGKCAFNEIKCRDGKGCVPKIRFCDRIVDCKDSR